jgi:hypothetical protein
MTNDKLTLEILQDGTIKSTADGISAANHDNAESFLRNVSTLAGGKVTRTLRTDLRPEELRRALEEHKKDGHTHTHSDGTTHKH